MVKLLITPFNGVSIHPVTKDTGVSRNSVAGEDGNLSDFTMRAMLTLKQSLMAVIGDKRIDQQHCNYSTIPT